MLLPTVHDADHLFLATYFTGNGESGVYVAVSEDGFKFEPILTPNVPLLTPQIGKDKLMRDACICLGPDRQWHMVWTSGWWDQEIGIAHSKDLANWSGQASVPVMNGFPTALNSWAPEIVFDVGAKRYLVYWSSTIPGRYPQTERKDGDLSRTGLPLDHRYYFTTTRDFEKWTPTKLLWDPGFNAIDATLLRRGQEWILFGKDETKAPKPHKFLFAARARALGDFSIGAPRITGAYWAEGPTALDLGDRVRVYFDRYVEDRWGAVESTDCVSWQDVSDRVRMVPHARHGTVVLVERAVVDQLRQLLRRRSTLTAGHARQEKARASSRTPK